MIAVNLPKRVNRYTRAGKGGKTIICPLCNATTHVGNFAWSSLLCSSCKEMIPKTTWIIEDNLPQQLELFGPEVDLGTKPKT